MELNEKQRMVASTLDRNIFLAAPAGTGYHEYNHTFYIDSLNSSI